MLFKYRYCNVSVVVQFSFGIPCCRGMHPTVHQRESILLCKKQLWFCLFLSAVGVFGFGSGPYMFSISIAPDPDSVSSVDLYLNWESGSRHPNVGSSQKRKEDKISCWTAHISNFCHKNSCSGSGLNTSLPKPRSGSGFSKLPEPGFWFGDLYTKRCPVTRFNPKHFKADRFKSAICLIHRYV